MTSYCLYVSRTTFARELIVAMAIGVAGNVCVKAVLSNSGVIISPPSVASGRRTDNQK